MINYEEPKVSIAVLDFCKPEETGLLLESLRARIKFPHKVIYLHNGGGEYYPYHFYKMGLIDSFIQTKENHGLGVGTRDLMAISFSPYTMYVQNDQILGRDFTENELNEMINLLDSNAIVQHNNENKLVRSISIAGAPCGYGIYSERAHLIKTNFYKEMESKIPLPIGGAGPYHHIQWREEAIQNYYKQANFIHLPWQRQLFIDNGKYTIRDLPCGGKIRMRTDTKSVRWLVLPKEKYIFPEMTEKEWSDSISGIWKNGTIPSEYLRKNESFNCWGDIES
jgi:hypothetical protein